jgi:hypothetical protein
MVAMGLQIQGHHFPGIWTCKDKNGDTVFSNQPGQYRECHPYVASPELRDAFLEEMLLNKRKQYSPHPLVPDLSRTKNEVIGPL